MQIIYKMLAAILHLGDIEFTETPGDDNTDNRATIFDTAPLNRGIANYRLYLASCTGEIYNINKNSVIKLQSIFRYIIYISYLPVIVPSKKVQPFQRLAGSNTENICVMTSTFIFLVCMLLCIYISI